MKKGLVVLAVLICALKANAQTDNSKIYESCSIHKDNTPEIDGGGEPVFDSCPQFRNGIKDLDQFISGNIHYPKNARKKRTEGRVFVSIVIEKDGSVSHPKIERGIEDDLDLEALRIVNTLPKWKPAILHGKPVSVKYVLAVDFKLSEKNNEKSKS